MGFYRPRRAAKRWLEGAPRHVLDCLDNGGETADRYTVLMTFPEFNTGNYATTTIPYLGMSPNPFHPQGVGCSGELSAYQAAAYRYRVSHDRVRWSDLPELVQRCVRQWGEPD